MLECGHCDVISWPLPKLTLRDFPAALRQPHDQAQISPEFLPKMRNPVPWNLVDF